MPKSETTELLNACQRGDVNAANRLFPLVYDELRRVASQKMAHELPGQTLCATALVHEAYLRLVDGNDTRSWENRRHFFSTAAVAMRHILVDQARRKNASKRGADWARVEFKADRLRDVDNPQELLALDEALTKLAASKEQIAQLVELRFFAGLTIPEAAKAMSISTRTADRWLAYARAWLFEEINGA